MEFLTNFRLKLIPVILIKLFFLLPLPNIKKQEHIAELKKLLSKPPISGPAAIESTKSDSLAILLSITLTRLKILHLFFFTNLSAARVSAVSPDCEINMNNVSFGIFNERFISIFRSKISCCIYFYILFNPIGCYLTCIK